MEIAREDWLLIFIVGAVVLPLGYSAVTSDGFTPETELEQYCVDIAAEVEANATFAHRLTDCRCVPPDRVDERQFTAPRKVENATNLFLVSCEFESGDKQIFPVRRIRDDYVGDLNRTNTSVLRDNP